MSKFLFLIASLFLFGRPVAVFSYVGQWKSYASYNAVNALISYQGNLYAGTNGGIRRINPKTLEEKDYSNSAGLTDLIIVALAIDDDNQLWAGAKSGQLFRLDGESWSSFGNAYRVSGWKINPRALIAAGNYLILGTEKGLSFFDRKKGVAQANLTKFGKSNVSPITGLVRVDDTLFISNGKEIFQTKIDFTNLLSSKFGTVFDPQVWMNASGVKTPVDLGFNDSIEVVTKVKKDTILVDSMVNQKDENLGIPIHLSYLEGKVVAYDTGTVLDYPYRVKAIYGRSLIIGKEENRNVKYYEVATALSDKIYLGGKYGLIRYEPKNLAFAAIAPPKFYPIDTVANISATPKGVFAMTGGKVGVRNSEVFQLVNDEWKSIFTYPQSKEVLENDLRNLTQTSLGEPIFGTWGFGVYVLKPNGNQQFVASKESCMPATDVPAYTVIHALSKPFENHLWGSVYRLQTSTETPWHWLVHMDLTTGKSSCPEIQAEGYHVFANRILSDTLMGEANDAGVFVYRWSANGDLNRLSLVGKVGSNSGSGEGRDLGMDRFGRLWVILNNRLGVVDSLNFKIANKTALTIDYPENMDGRGCRMMESDALETLWIGCDNGLYHIQPTSQALSPLVKHYLTTDGLAANRVFDISVDKQSGKIWMATEGGVTVYESLQQPLIAGLENVRGYPNPFLKKHALFIIDQVPAGSTANILTQSGEVVKHFTSRDAKGSQFQWDGNNEKGNAVTPGIYFYTVVADAKSSRGKIMLAR